MSIVERITVLLEQLSLMVRPMHKHLFDRRTSLRLWIGSRRTDWPRRALE